MGSQVESARVLRQALHRLYPNQPIRVRIEYRTVIRWVDGITPSAMLESITHLKGNYCKGLEDYRYPELRRYYTKPFIDQAIRDFDMPIKITPFAMDGFYWAKFEPNYLPAYGEYFSVLFFRFINERSGEFGKWINK